MQSDIPDTSVATNSPSVTPNTLVIATINANVALKTNIVSYISFMHQFQIDLLCIQEPGQTISNTTSSNSPDPNPLYELKQSKISSITQHNPDS
jgi:hypothetical protein